jgi:hypothetical protein
MGLFDFLKKKELEEIADLKIRLEEISVLTQKLATYSTIIDIEQEVAARTKALENYQGQKQEELRQLVETKKAEEEKLVISIQELNADYQSSLAIYAKLKKEVNTFESKLDLIEHGIYEPIYDFEKSDDYRAEQNKIIEFQKAMIRKDEAAICNTKWTVGDSEAKGKLVVNRYKKLMLRAFNGESDALIAKVKWNNVSQMKDRMGKLFEAINKLGEGFNVVINSDYLELKRKELILEHEYQAKRQQEKEEMRAIQDELREEEKARREFEVAQKEAEKEEANYQKVLDKARLEIEQAVGERHEKLKQQILQLELELKAAQEKKERALSMAQQTKRGHVYIISNIGAFGENVYKIGMTRRLEPTDRIKELGDASVPFQFDIHAIIYSDVARTLECELHNAFTQKKVNMLNYRKEFFNVTLEEIESKIKELGFDAEFTRLPEAMEYRETLAIHQRLKEVPTIQVIDVTADEFPSSLSN